MKPFILERKFFTPSEEIVTKTKKTPFECKTEIIFK